MTQIDSKSVDPPIHLGKNVFLKLTQLEMTGAKNVCYELMKMNLYLKKVSSVVKCCIMPRMIR